jgi:hypothetical protein
VIDGRTVDHYAALCQKIDHILIGSWVTQVPTHSTQDDLLWKAMIVNGGVKLGHWAAQNWATLGLRGTRVMSGGQSAALSM